MACDATNGEAASSSGGSTKWSVDGAAVVLEAVVAGSCTDGDSVSGDASRELFGSLMICMCAVW